VLWVFEVISRYFFRAPTIWAYDISYMLYSAIFMLGAAHTLRRGEHVRTDFLCRILSVRGQGIVDSINAIQKLAVVLVLVFPGPCPLAAPGSVWLMLSPPRSPALSAQELQRMVAPAIG
jgi:TRAP-type mannitol/chloroaromatic compound transport system permease small subunit